MVGKVEGGDWQRRGCCPHLILVTLSGGDFGDSPWDQSFAAGLEVGWAGGQRARDKNSGASI